MRLSSSRYTRGIIMGNQSILNTLLHSESVSSLFVMEMTMFKRGTIHTLPTRQSRSGDETLQ